MRSRVSWTSLVAVAVCVVAVVLAASGWHSEVAIPLTGLGVVLALIALRE